MVSEMDLKKRLKVLMDKPENQLCCDCNDKKPTWATLIVAPPRSPNTNTKEKLGAFCCFHCSGAHRRLGVHICFVRSLTLDEWKEKEVIAMEMGGNKRVNKAFEALLGDSIILKPCPRADLPARERFIKEKYEKQSYLDTDALLAMMQSNKSADSSKLIKDKKNMANLRGCSELLFAGMSQENLFSDYNVEMFHKGCVRVESNMDLLHGSKMETFGSSGDDFDLVKADSQNSKETKVEKVLELQQNSTKKQPSQSSHQDDMDGSPLLASPIADGSGTKKMEREARSGICESGENHNTFLQELKPDETLIPLKDRPGPMSRVRRAGGSESAGSKSRRRLPQSSTRRSGRSKSRTGSSGGRSRSESMNRRSDGKSKSRRIRRSNSKGPIDASSDHEPMVRWRRTCNQESPLDTKSNHELSMVKPMVKVRRSTSCSQESLEVKSIHEHSRARIRRSTNNESLEIKSNGELTTSPPRIHCTNSRRKSLDVNEPITARTRRSNSRITLLDSNSGNQPSSRVNRSSNKDYLDSFDSKIEQSSMSRNGRSPLVVLGSPPSSKSPPAPSCRDQLRRAMTSFEIKTSQKATIVPSPISKHDDETEETTASDNSSLCDDSEEFAKSDLEPMVRVLPVRRTCNQESHDVKSIHKPMVRVRRSTSCSQESPDDAGSSHKPMVRVSPRSSCSQEYLDVKSTSQHEPNATFRRSSSNGSLEIKSNNALTMSQTRHTNSRRKSLDVNEPTEERIRRSNSRRILLLDWNSGHKPACPRASRLSNRDDSLDSKNGRSPLPPLGSTSSIKSLAPSRRDQLRQAMNSFEIKTSHKATIVPSPISKHDDETETASSDNSSLRDDSEEFIDKKNMANLKGCSELFAGMSHKDLFSDSNVEMFQKGCVRVESNMDLLHGSKMETFRSPGDDFDLL